MHSTNRSFLGAAIATAALNLSTETASEASHTNIVEVLTARWVSSIFSWAISAGVT